MPHPPTSIHQRLAPELGVWVGRLADRHAGAFAELPALLTEGGLDAAELQRAVEATFARRKLALPLAVPMGLSDAFAQDAAKQRQWSAFLKKNQLQALNLGETVALLRSEFQKLQAG